MFLFFILDYTTETSTGRIWSVWTQTTFGESVWHVLGRWKNYWSYSGTYWQRNLQETKVSFISRFMVPSSAINIDTSVNAAFTADKRNAVKSYVDITDLWHVHYKRAKTFLFSLSRYYGVDRQSESRIILLPLFFISAE